ncbi:MAG: pyridoxal phosphate-dependent aminotransferase [Chloroflexi bacterium]|nr:pyridoxal phosphate-dependent aminotransferase [Chloroflexota bacterium]
MAIAGKVRRHMKEASWIRRMFEAGIALKQQYGPEKVFDLSLGNPILEPPARFQEEMERLARSPKLGMHRYMPNAGYPETREAVAAYIKRETGLPFTLNEVVMTCGAGGGLNVVLKAILDPGDEVVVFAPYFPEYPFYIDNHGGTTVTVSTDRAFLPDLAALERCLSPRTRAVIINSPNNPSGVVYPSGHLKELGGLLERKMAQSGRTIYLVSDEPYARLIYDGLKYPYPYPHYRHTIAATSYSKDLSLAGERIGYIAVNPECPGKKELLDALVFCNRVLGFVNAPALMQHLVARLADVTVDVGWYQERRDRLYGALTEEGYQVIRPQGAFYLFPRSPLEDDVAFVQELQRNLVLAVPGQGFGTPGYLRLCYSVEDWVLDGAIDGLRKVARGMAHGSG